MEASEFPKILLALVKKHGGDKRGNQAFVAKKLGIDEQLIGQYLKGRHMPKSDFFIKWKEVFGEDLLQGNETNVYKGMENSSIDPTPTGHFKETFYAELIEKNEVYALIPRAVLTDYKIVPDKIMDIITKSSEGEKEAIIARYEVEKEALIAKYDLIVDGHKSKSARLEADVIRLEAEKAELQRQIAAKGK